mmetsp:Transcript_18648/g.45873  ORF Transcript_18648/g.45873 Transcript_18648/m.45873 type:complete len:401 (-) Transcript_18648:158-1360(-)
MKKIKVSSKPPKKLLRGPSKIHKCVRAVRLCAVRLAGTVDVAEGVVVVVVIIVLLAVLLRELHGPQHRCAAAPGPHVGVLPAELKGAPVRRPDSVVDSRSESPPLERVLRARRRPAGGDDVVAQGRDALLAVDGVHARAKERLLHEALRHGAREPHVHASVDHRLHSEEQVVRARARDSRRHVEVALIRHHHVVANGGEHPRESLQLVLADLVRGHPHNAPLLDGHGGVGHGAHDPGHPALLVQPGHRLASHDGDEAQLLGGLALGAVDGLVQVSKHTLRLLRLHSQHDDIGVLGEARQLLGALDAGVAVRDALARRLPHVVHAHCLGGLDPLGEHARDHRLGHLAGADEGDLVDLGRRRLILVLRERRIRGEGTPAGTGEVRSEGPETGRRGPGRGEKP